MLFGAKLRRRRLEVGWSLTDLARVVHYSKSHLSKVETGHKIPSVDLARRCDSVLDCRGELASLVKASVPNRSARGDAQPDEIWLLALDTDGGSRFATASRTEARQRGLAPRRAAQTAGHVDETALTSFRTMFDEMRKLGQSMSATALMPTLVSQTHLLQTVASATTDPALRDAALVLAARFAEFAGWMAQEDGNNSDAERWTDRAVELAAAGSDHEMAAYALVRRALITLYNHDAVGTVALARQAQLSADSARTRGLAAQREAQGHAIAGDYDACFRALDHAAGLLRKPADRDHGPIMGTSNVADPVGMATGWCLFDLGQPAEAVEILRRELDLIPAHALRARSRFGARLALALAGSGEVEEACQVTERVLGTHDDVDSATIRIDLRNLSRTLNRWHAQPDVRRVMPRLNEALHAVRPT